MQKTRNSTISTNRLPGSANWSFCSTNGSSRPEACSSDKMGHWYNKDPKAPNLPAFLLQKYPNYEISYHCYPPLPFLFRTSYGTE